MNSHVRFGIATGLSFLIATNGADVFARMDIGNESLGKAASESFYYAAIQPVGTLLLLAPFVVVAWLSSRVEQRVSQLPAWIFFALSIGALGWLYFDGYQSAQHALLQRKWT